jgi:hypothetical protein
MENEFSQILEEYNKLKDVNYVSSNINNIDAEVICWKERLLTFTQRNKVVSEDIKSKIQEMEQNIIQKIKEKEDLHRLKELFSIEEDLHTIDLCTFDSEFTELFIFGDKNSKSASLIIRGKYRGKPVYIKIFDTKNSELNEELKYYKYISRAQEHLDPSIKEYIDDCFIKLEASFLLNKEEFFKYLQEKKIMQITKKREEERINEKKLYYSSVEPSVIKVIPKIFTSKFLCFIVTEDIGDLPLYLVLLKINQKFNDNLDVKTVKNIINILFEIFYSIYILNKYLNLVHNDLNLRNIIFLKRNPSQKKKYIIGNVKIIRNSNFRLAIFDFDKSSEMYPEAEKDDFILFFRNIQIIFSKFKNIKELFYDKIFIKKLKINTNKKKGDEPDFVVDETDIFTDEEIKNLYYPENMLKRFIQVFYRELGIEEVNPYFKKYLKYKNKYLKYKNKFIK